MESGREWITVDTWTCLGEEVIGVGWDLIQNYPRAVDIAYGGLRRIDRGLHSEKKRLLERNSLVSCGEITNATFAIRQPTWKHC